MNRQSQNSSTSDWLLGALKQNPEGLLLLAAGAALLMRTGSRGNASQAYAAAADSIGAASSSARGAASSAANSVSQAASDARNYAADTAERTMDKAGQWASSASEAAGEARRAVSQHSERFARQAQSTFQGTMNRVLQDQPLLVALAGLAAGAALAATFPATDFEKQNLGPIGDQVTDAAGRIGEQLKEATAKAGETLKSAADQRGLNSEGLKDVAAEVAGAFSSGMGGETDRPSGSSSVGSNPSNRSE